MKKLTDKEFKKYITERNIVGNIKIFENISRTRLKERKKKFNNYNNRTAE